MKKHILFLITLLLSIFAFTSNAKAITYKQFSGEVDRYELRFFVSGQEYRLVYDYGLEQDYFLFDKNGKRDTAKENHYKSLPPMIHYSKEKESQFIWTFLGCNSTNNVCRNYYLNDKEFFIDDNTGVYEWYDNPELTGEPLGFIDASKLDHDMIVYGKPVPAITVYVDGKKKSMIIGHTYDYTYLDSFNNLDDNKAAIREINSSDGLTITGNPNDGYRYNSNSVINSVRAVYDMNSGNAHVDASDPTFLYTYESDFFTKDDPTEPDEFGDILKTHLYINTRGTDGWYYGGIHIRELVEGIAWGQNYQSHSLKYDEIMPKYYKVLDMIDEEGNSYPFNGYVAKAEDDGKNFTLVLSDEVCAFQLLYYYTALGPKKQEAVYPFLGFSLIDNDAEDMVYYLNGYVVGVNTCNTHDFNLKAHYKDLSNDQAYAIIKLDDKSTEPVSVLKGTNYTIPMPDEKPSESFVVTFDFQDGVTQPEVVVGTKNYTPIGYTIDGINYNAGDTIFVTKNLVLSPYYEETITNIDFPQVPSRQYYTFKGWFDLKSAGKIVNEIKPETQTIYAQWTEKDKVTVIRPDGIAVMINKGSNYTLPFIPKKNPDILATVIGYHNDGSGEYALDYVKKNYTIDGYTIKGQKYNVGDVIVVNEDLDLTKCTNYNEEITGITLRELTKEDYTFLGWYDSIENGNKYTEYNGTENLTLYARWQDEKTTVTIKYVSNDEMDESNDSMPPGFVKNVYEVKKGSEYKLLKSETSTRSINIIFDYQDGVTPIDYSKWSTIHRIGNGWFIDGKHYDSNEIIIVNKDIVVYYDYVKTYSLIDFPIPTRVGYRFLGWYDDPTEGTKYTTYEGFSSITLYAHWEKIDEKYILPEIPAKDPEVIATVTLKYQDGKTNDSIKYVNKVYNAKNYTVDGETYNVGDAVNVSEDSVITPNYEEEIIGVDLYAATREGYHFQGWYDDQTDGTKYNKYEGSEDITLYAHWIEQPDILDSTLCKRATTLHTAYGKTFGQLGTVGELVPGDAFDCDVNGDGIYDAQTERFYYVNDYFDASTNSFNENYATLIYYADYYNGPLSSVSKDGFTTYNGTVPNDGPTSAIQVLPTTDEWSNVTLYKTTRDLSSPSNSKSNSNGAYGSINYTGYAARMLHGMELFQSGCLYSYNNKILAQYYNMNNSCSFLTENIRTAPDGRKESSYWIESPGGYCPTGWCPSTRISPDYNKYGWTLVKSNSNDYSNYLYQAQIEWSRGVRPVIDVAKNRMEDVPEHTIYHTITYPEGQVQTSLHKSTFVFGDVNNTTETTEYTVTFKYNNGSDDTTSKVKTIKKPVAYKIGNTRYNKGNSLLVLDDYVLEYIYEETVTPATFPSDPEKEGYTFAGWYDAQAGGNKYTSYEELKDITLYARWVGGNHGPEPITGTIATFLSGPDFNTKMRSLTVKDVDYTFRPATSEEYEDIASTMTSNNIYSTNDSDEPIYMWVNSENEVLYYSEADNILLNENAYQMFYAWIKTNKNRRTFTSIDLSIVKSPYTTNMSEMFYFQQNLVSVNLDNFDTSNVEDMGGMFSKCESLLELDIAHFNTSNVTNMKSMFNNTQSLTKLDVSNFDTSNVTDMSSMFNNAYLLTELDVSNFDTSNVTDFNGMFQHCRSLTELDLRSFDVSNSNNINGMFASMTSITELDLSSFVTTNDTQYGNLFFGADKLVTVYVSDRWNTYWNNGAWAFDGTTSIVGQKGTTHDENHIDGTYARIDNAPTTLGYFTYKEYNPVTPNPPSPYTTYYTVTYPNGDTEQVEKGATWTFPRNNSIKESEDVSTVTFVYDNGSSNTTSKVVKSFIPNGWTIDVDDEHYSDGDTYIVNSDITLSYDYVETIVGASFPENPTKQGYKFVGWFDDATNGTKYESYNGNEDLTLYARWQDEKLPDGCEVGVACTIPQAPEKPDQNRVSVTYKFQDNVTPDYVAYVVDRYTPNGYRDVNTNIHYPAGSIIIPTDDMVLVPAYTTTTIPVRNPEAPEREGYYFLGWYESLTGGLKFIDGYSGLIDRVVYARWNVKAVEHDEPLCRRLGDSIDPLAVGDAFVCDVNNDGNFNENNEIFYYVSDYYDTHTKEFNSEYAALIYFANISEGYPDIPEYNSGWINTTSYANSEWGYNEGITYNGPTSAIQFLPTEEEWPNAKLYQTERNILTVDGNNYNYYDGELKYLPEDFSYEGYAARLITVQEIKNGCGLNISSTKFPYYNNKCSFLGSNLYYSDDSVQFNPIYGYYSENPIDMTQNGTDYRYIYYKSKPIILSEIGIDYYTSDGVGVRPVIDVKKSQLEIKPIETHTITFPDGTIEIVEHGTNYTLPDDTDVSIDEILSTVTFKYNNGEADTTSNVVKHKVANGWIIDEEHYDTGYIYTVNNDIVLAYDYDETIDEAVFPVNPSSVVGIFTGWYDINDTKYTSYSGNVDITLSAKYEGLVYHTVTLPNQTFKVLHGEEFILPKNDISKQNTSTTVTFKYHNGNPDTTTNVVTEYEVNGWTIDGNNYSNSERIVVDRDITVVPNYNEIIKNGSFPERPTKEGYEFVGWFTEETGGEQVTVLRGSQNIILHAQYTNNYALLKKGSEIENRLIELGQSVFLQDILYSGSGVIFRKATEQEFNAKEQEGFNSQNIISTTDSPNVVYLWLQGDDMLYYSDADVIFMNEDSRNMFYVSIGYNGQYYYSRFKSIDLSGLNSSKVTNLSEMFAYSYALTDLNFGNFDTSKVTNMSSMFNGVMKLDTIDLSSFDTSNVTNMSSMFGWTGFKSLDLSNFDTSNVQNMFAMFSLDFNLEDIDLSNFNTSNVTDMSYMFTASKFKHLNVSSFDTSKVTNMSYMFDEIEDIEEIDLSSFDTSNVTNMSSMFNCEFNLLSTLRSDEELNCKLKTIYVSDKWNTNKVSSSYGMFTEDNRLVGQAGTTYDSNYTDKEYAHVDEGSSNPGYLTLKGKKYKVTYPDDSSIFVNPGTELSLSNTPNTVNDKVIVTFKYGNGQEDTISEVNKSIATNGWKINNTHYNVGDKYTVYSDVILHYDGNTTSTTEAVFPSDPTKEYATFIGWYDQEEGGNKYTSYNGTEDITLYAHWNEEYCKITFPNEVVSVKCNSVYELPKNTIAKDSEVISTVTFKYHNGNPDTTSNVVTSYVPHGWSINGEKYENKTKIAVTNNITVMPEYDLFVQNAVFPNDPTKEGYEFTGWYTQETGGSLVKYLRGEQDTIVHAQYTNNYALLLNGRNFNNKINNIPNIPKTTTDASQTVSFRKATQSEYNDIADSIDTKAVVLSTTDSPNVVYGWLTDNYEVLYYSTADVIYANPDCSYMFQSASNKARFTIVDLSGINTSKVTSMSYMFDFSFSTTAHKSKLTSINFDNIDTHNVTNMSYMFHLNRYIQSIDVSDFDTSKVTNMSNMFAACDRLTGLDLSNFDTHNVTNMNSMFNQNYSETSFNLSNFDTSNVTDMGNMLSHSGVRTLDLSNFNTSKVTNMSGMFSGDSNLESVDLSSFDTSKVTTMALMFYSCGSLTTLDLSNFDTRSLTNIIQMFIDNTSLKTVYVSDKWTNSKISSTAGVFEGSTKLVGGKGTKYSIDHIGPDYAQADGGTSNPGYFTLKGEINTYTITYPDGTTEEVVAGTNYLFRDTVPEKDDEIIAVVRFNPENGQNPILSNVTASYTPNGWKIGNTHYNIGESYVVNSDITLEYDYIETITPAVFPENPVLSGDTFLGWFDSKDGGIEYTSYAEAGNINLYAHWLNGGKPPVNGDILCKRATSLHKEKCNITEENTDYYTNDCYKDGYYKDGEKGTDIVTYGNFGTDGLLTVGDAFTCDVNGDGIFNEETERFYYVNKLYDSNTGSFDDNYATLVYYNNVDNGVISRYNVTSYNDLYYDYEYVNHNLVVHTHGPTEAIKELPTIYQWSNTSLKNTNRQNTTIYGDSEYVDKSGNTYILPMLSYENKSARLLHSIEIFDACGYEFLYDPSVEKDANILSGDKSICRFLSENTAYTDLTNYEIVDSYTPSGYWIESEWGTLEKYFIKSNALMLRISAGYYDMSHARDPQLGVRPAIDVPINRMDLSVPVHYEIRIDGELVDTVKENTPYVVPTLEEKENEIISTVTFKYNNTDADTTSEVIKEYTVNGYEYNDNIYTEGNIIVVNEDIDLISNYTENLYSAQFPNDPEKEGYLFRGWFDSLENGNRYSEYDGEDDLTLYAQYLEYNPEEDAIVHLFDGDTEDILVVKKGTVWNISSNSTTNNISFNIKNNIDDNNIDMSISTTKTVDYEEIDGTKYYPESTYTINNDVVIKRVYNEETTKDCNGECPVFINVGDTTNGKIYNGIFTEENGQGNKVDIDKLTGNDSKYDNATLWQYYTNEDDSVILTVDGEISIIPKGLGNIPSAKEKDKSYITVTYNYNDSNNRVITDRIEVNYVFDHYNVVGKGSYNAGVEYDYQENTTMFSVFEKQYSYNDMPVIQSANFIGWFTKPNGGDKVETLKGIEEDITLYARYNNVPVIIKVDENEYEVNYGSEFTLPNATSKQNDSITLNLDYNYDNLTEQKTITTSYTFKNYTSNNEEYDEGYKFNATEDKEFTSVYEENTVISPEYVEPTRENYEFISWLDENDNKVNINNIKGSDINYNNKTLTAYFEELDSNKVVVTYDGEKLVLEKGSDLSSLGESSIKPVDETFNVNIDRNNSTYIVDKVLVTKSYELDKYIINGVEYSADSNYVFNENAVVTTTYKANYNPNIFENLPQGVSGLYTMAIGGERVENYDNVNDNDTLYYHYSLLHTITVDGEVIATVEHGGSYTLPINTKAKDMEDVATVTFDYADGRDNTYGYVRKRFNSNGYMLGDVHYNNRETIIVNEDMAFVRDYYESLQGVDFPTVPKRTNYRFDGWYNNDIQVTSYNASQDVTLTAHWIKQVIVTNSVDKTIEIVDEGTKLILEDRPNLNEKFYNITFKYNYSGSPADKVVRISTEEDLNGWLVNGTFNNIGNEITFIDNTTLDGSYDLVINNKNLPSEPERDGYVFLGWYDSEINGTIVNINEISTDKTVYAHWEEYDPNKVKLTWDGEVTIHDKGDIINLDREDNKTYEERIATITFIMNHELYENKVVYVNKKYTRDHYMINGLAYMDNVEYVLNEDTVIETVYTNEIVYPKLPIVNDNTFKGFYTALRGGDKIESLDGITTDARYYAHWETEKVPVIIDGNEIEVIKGTEITLENGKNKDSKSISITLDYNNNLTKDVSITTSYTFSHYLVNGAKYNPGDKYIANERTVIDSIYDEEVTNNFVGEDNQNWDLGYAKGEELLTSWLDNPNGNEFDLNTLTGVSTNYNDHTFYANYSENLGQVNVTIDSMDSYTVNTGKHILIPQDKELTLDKPNDETFTITFDKNNGTGTITVTGTKSYEFSHFTVDGNGKYQRNDNYTFYKDTIITSMYNEVYSYSQNSLPTVNDNLIGWFTEREGGSQVTEIAEIKEEITLYAHYRNEGEKVVYFDGKAFIYDDTITSVDPVVEGYASSAKIDINTLTLDYQKVSHQNISEEFEVIRKLEGWYKEDDLDNLYEGVIDLTNVLDGTHFISSYEDGLLNVNLDNYNPSDIEFIGWYDDPIDGEQVTSFVGGNEIYYAHYTNDQQAIVTIDGNISIYNIGEILTLPSANNKNNSSIVVTFNPENGDEVFTKNITTIYTFNGYRYEKDNEIYQSTHEFIVNENMTFNSEYTENVVADEWPINPEKENYAFIGWYTNATSGVQVFNFNEIESNTNLYAHYTTDPDSFITLTNTITNEEERILKNSDYVFRNSKFNKDKKDKMGTITYKFNASGYPDEVKDYYTTSTPSGYYVNNDTTTLHSIDEVENFSEDTLITPYYAEENIVKDSHVGLDQFEYEITNGEKQAVCFSKTQQTDPYDNLEYDCYTEYQENDENITLYLHWKDTEYVDITKPNGEVIEVEKGSEYSLGTNNISKDGINFVVTFKYQDDVTSDTTSTLNTTFTPNGWLVNGVHYDDNVSIIANENITIIPDYTESNTTITIPSASKDGYVLEGWNENSNGTGKYYTNSELNSITKSGNMTLYAIWSNDEFTVTFNANGGTLDPDNETITRNYNEEIGTLPTVSKDGYDFEGWFTDTTYTEEVSATTKVKSDMTIYAKLVENKFPYVYPTDPEIIDDPVIFNGENYINTHVKLYNDTNWKKDYEIGFTILEYNGSGTEKQGVFVNAKLENQSLKWPGLVFRKKDNDSTKVEITQSINNGTKASYTLEEYQLPLKVKIIRKNKKIYYSFNDGEWQFLQDMSNFNQQHEVETWFGAADNGSGTPFRYVKAKMTDMYVRLGEMPDENQYTITLPDGHIEYHNLGDEIDLSEYQISKPSTNISRVTFKYQDNVTADTYSYVTKSYTQNGWLINDEAYNEDILVVTGDAVVLPAYVETVIPAVFPNDPEKENYIFEGWYLGNTKYESYDGEEDITLYGNWTGEDITITTPNEEIIVPYGSDYTLPINSESKEDDILSTITFKYYNGLMDTTSNVKKTYTPNGWLINGVHYDNNETISVTSNITLVPDYVDAVIPAEFPNDPVRAHYTFDGWFDTVNGGNNYTSYSREEDITLHANYIGDDVIETDPEGNEIPHKYGDEITLPENDIVKANDITIVTFVPNNGEDDYISYVTQVYTPNGWLINGVHYDNGATYTVNGNYERIPDYTYEITPATFPEDPEKENYVFEGWYSGEDKYTSYALMDSLVLTARWKGNTITEIDPEGNEVEHNYGDQITLPENDINKLDETAEVTFIYGNGNTNTYSSVTKTYTPNGWLINGVHYDNGATYTVTEDYERIPDYIEIIVPAVFPSNPTKENYTFDGWFNGNTKYTSYSELQDIILTAKWTGESIQVCILGECNEVPYGTEQDLGENNEPKENTVVSTVTFKYHNGEDDTTSDVIKTYTPSGWLVNGEVKADNEVITITGTTVIERNYIEVIVGAIFPSDPEKEHYTFNGWFDSEENGTKYTSYNEESDITLHATYVGEDITITTPNGDITVHYGDEYELPENNIAKDSEVIGTVIFKPQNGDEDITSDVIKTFTPNGWLIGDEHYDDNEIITVTENIIIIPDYEVESVIPAIFPDDPEKEHYVFNGWFDREEEGTKYTEYDGEDDLILFAQYIGEDITITTPNGDITVHYGDEYELPENNIAKDSEIISTVTFKYYNDLDDTTSNVLRTYTPSGWLIDGTHYDDKIVVTKNITLVPDYIENVVPAQFPNNPEKLGHAFTGWYDAIEEGTMYTEYNGENDITLHARWEKTGPTDIELDVNDLLIVKGETHQIVITTTPVDAIATYTYTGYDNDIITVNNNGLITAVSKGETTITVSVVDSNITKQMNVTVLDDQITSDVYTVTNKDLTGEDLRIIIGAEPETTIDEFLNSVNNDRQYIKVYNKDDELVSSEDYESTFITTGARLKLVINGHEYDNVIVIIRGDLNKDGKINILDSTKMNNHIMKKSIIEDYVIYAANIVEREDETMETAINVMDSSELNKYILKKIDSLNERDGD